MDITIEPVQTVVEQLTEIRGVLQQVQTRLLSIESQIDSGIKLPEDTKVKTTVLTLASCGMQELFTTLEVKQPSFTDLLCALNTYLVQQRCVDAQLEITPNDYMKAVFAITDKISYANLLQLLILKLKIDITRMNLYV